MDEKKNAAHGPRFFIESYFYGLTLEEVLNLIKKTLVSSTRSGLKALALIELLEELFLVVRE